MDPAQGCGMLRKNLQVGGVKLEVTGERKTILFSHTVLAFLNS